MEHDYRWSYDYIKSMIIGKEHDYRWSMIIGGAWL